MKRLKVGITAFPVGDALGALWSSGLNQNIAYLAMLLQRLPQVEICALVPWPPTEGETSHPLAEHFGLPTVQLETACQSFDIIIELGARAETTYTKPFRERGGKLVSYMAGNAMVMNFEDLANDVPYGDYINEVGFDACWITPQHWHMNHAYCALTRTPNVMVAPHIWHPVCLTQSAYRAKLNPFWRPPAEDRWRIGVFDPNVNVVKTFHLPLLVCEQAHRAQAGLIDRVLLFSANHLMGNQHFEQFCAACDLHREGKVFAESRYLVAEMLGTHIDAVVTHQWENNLNYLYWDVLYLGWPLIHNSPEFREAGYYYPEFDPVAGGAVLREALNTHVAEQAARRPAVLETLWGFHIDNPAVQARHSELLEQVMSTNGP